MSYYPSNQGYIGVASQASLKTTVKTTSKIFVQYMSDDIEPEFDSEVLSEGGDGRYSVTSLKTQHREKVGFSGYARPKVSAYMFAALMGKDVPSHLTTTPFYHTITIKTTDLATSTLQPWLTVEKMLNTSSDTQRIRSVKLSSITLEAEAGQPVMQTVEGTGLSGAVVTTKQTATYETDKPFSFYHGTFHVNAPTTTNFDIKSFSVTVTSINDEEIQTTGLTRQDIINHKFNVEFTIGLNYTDFTMWKKANYAASTIPLEHFSDGSLTINLDTSSSTNERRLQLAIPNVRFEAHKVGLDPSPITMEQPLSGIALKQSTTDLVTVTAYNTIATTLPT